MILKSIWNWLVFSSADPDKLSLTLKAAIPFIVFLRYGNQVELGGAIDAVTHLVVLLVTCITGAMTAYGALRKVYLTAFSH